MAVQYGVTTVERSLISKMVKKFSCSTDFEINVALDTAHPKMTPNAPSVEQVRAFPNMELNCISLHSIFNPFQKSIENVVHNS